LRSISVFFAALAVGSSDQALSHLLIALIVIVIVARLLGTAAKTIGQPPVVGEMIAGILIGPSVMGHWLPRVSAFLFPSQVLPYLSAVSQIAVIFFMFLVGVDLDAGLLRQKGGSSLVISQASIFAPFVLGAALAPWLYSSLSAPGVSFAVFALFLGISMSVTAFPVLARILRDRQMHKSDLGTMALACAAVDDVIAWCLLAFVVGMASSGPRQALVTIALTAAFIAIVLVVVRPVAVRFARAQPVGGDALQRTIVVVCIAAFLASVATDWIGIHVFFGAFLVGLVVPHDSPVALQIKSRFEDTVSALLLPVFFVLTGLRTQIGLIHGHRNWLICAVVIAVASVGKVGGTYFAARFCGMTGRRAAALGVLMNARGLMELIVLNVGLDLGVLSPALFAMLVVMAVVTTFTTAPFLHLLAIEKP